MSLASAVLVPTDHFGNLEEGPIDLRGVGQDLVQRQGGLDMVLPQDVGQGNRMGHWLHATDVHLTDLGDVMKDRFELGREALKLGVGKRQTGELGDVSDIGEAVGVLRHRSRLYRSLDDARKWGCEMRLSSGFGLSDGPVAPAVSR
jgi:hypothetical protein